MDQTLTAFTVVIPTKDRPLLLLVAVQSAARQLMPADRIIVVDDGGAQPAAAPLRAALAETMPSFDQAAMTIVRNETSQRSAFSRNRGAALAKTSKIIFLDDDDVFVDGYLDALRRFWREDTMVDYGYCATTKTARADATPTFDPLPSRPSRLHLFPLSLGVWVTKDAFESIDGLRPELTTNQDTEFCINLARHGLRGVKYRRAGVDIDTGADARSRASQNQAANITKSMKTQVRANCFHRILTLHASYFSQPDAEVFRTFCIQRYVELSAKAKVTYSLPADIVNQLSQGQRLKWHGAYWLNRALRAVTGTSTGQ